MLPLPLTPLLGRARELDETQRLLAAARLLTITGPGGGGKTRIALELGRRAGDRFEEVYWVDLAPISDPELVPQQILSAMGSRELPVQDTIQFIVDTIRDDALLFVIDNCEHLIDECAAVAEAILRGCPATTILATSREPLGIAGEQTWLVPPLSEEDAVQLFVERARAVAPAFEKTADNEKAIASICRRLDGIPLAIELAAARVRVLPPEQIAERLADAFSVLSSGSRTVPRHRTLRETIDWSYRLLDEDEQVLFRRLAVFAGTFSLAAAEAVCGDVLELLSALVEKSLVLVERDGYRLLDTVRQFAAEKLDESGERERLRERHARFFLEEMERAEPRIFAGGSDAATMRRVDREFDNVRAVFDWAEKDPAGAEIALRLVYAIHWYWFARGHFHEARRRITAALSRAAGVDPMIRARAAVAAGDAAVWQADWRALRPMIDDALATLREGSDLRPLAVAQMLLGVALAFDADDAEGARRMLEEAKTTARRNGRDVALALILYWSGLAAQLRGDRAAARAELEEAHAIGEEIGNRNAIGHPLTALGYLALHERKLDEAMRCFRRALDVHSETDDRWGLTQVVEGIGLVLLDTGDAETGTRLLAAASNAWLQLGARPGRREDFEREKDERLRQALGNEKLRVVLASGTGLSYEAMVQLAREHVTGTATSSMLRVRALGPFEIDGKRLDESARARDLLVFLLTHPSGSTKEQIGAALWPDADPAKLRNNFHVTLHRLRKLLGGAEWVLVDGESYALGPGIDFDATTFESEATASLKAKDADRLANAVSLYRGDFLETANVGEWALEIRDRLRDLYAKSLTTLGRLKMTAGDYAGAADAYQRIVALDDLDEEAARNLMTALAKQGEKATAARVYKRLADALKRELNELPEPATRKLFETL